MNRATWRHRAWATSLMLLGAGRASAEPTATQAKGGPAPNPAVSSPAKAPDAKPAREAPKGHWYDPLARVFAQGRRSRCETALCWGGNEGNGWAIEPLIELPIGKTFAIPIPHANSTLGRWIDTHDLSVSFAGGLRFWGWEDFFSVSTYFSQPLTNGSGSIHVKGSDFQYAVSNVRRPYPGIALGLLGDTLWFGFDYQELVNGDSSGNIDRRYAPSAVVSRAWSLTIGLATVNSVRWGLGTVMAKKQQQAQEDIVKLLVSEVEEAATTAKAAADDANDAAEKVKAGAERVEATVAALKSSPDDPALKGNARKALDAATLAQGSAQYRLDLAKAKLDAAKAKLARARDKIEIARPKGYKKKLDGAEGKVTGAEGVVKEAEDTLASATDRLKKAGAPAGP